MSAEGVRVLVVRAAYALALIVGVAYAVLTMEAAWASGTLGFDYRAYDLAVDRMLAGQTMYDPTAQQTGGFGLFFYPPPFALFVLPVALLPLDMAVLVWTGLLVAASVVAIWLLPIPARMRWVVLLLAALSWPMVYSIKLGQVGPLVLLTFAIGWRWMDQAWRLGGAIAAGALIKLQPGALVGWAILTGRRKAAAIAVGLFAAAGLIATVVAGPSSWIDELALLRRVSDPVLTPHAFGVGRLLYEAGVPADVASIAQLANTAVVALMTLVAVLRASPIGSYLAVVVASQFVSPVLWDHYAVMLLLPVAWLLARGRWWAALIPLATSTPLMLLQVPGSPWIYPIVFWVTLLAVTWEGIRQRQVGRVDAWIARN